MDAKKAKAVADFAWAVATAAMDDGALYAAMNKTAFYQFAIEVVNPLGKRWEPEEWLLDESFPQRHQWAESIEGIYDVYQKRLTEGADPAGVVPDEVKAIRAELEDVKKQMLEVMAAANKPADEPAPADDGPAPGDDAEETEEPDEEDAAEEA